jgi:hypothetical protein
LKFSVVFHEYIQEAGVSSEKILAHLVRGLNLSRDVRAMLTKENIEYFIPQKCRNYNWRS